MKVSPLVFTCPLLWASDRWKTKFIPGMKLWASALIQKLSSVWIRNCGTRRRAEPGFGASQTPGPSLCVPGCVK